MFERIGAFHLGKGHRDPIAALEGELERTSCKEALIVLPEAFNLGRPYSGNPGAPTFEKDSVLEQLSAISSRLTIAFVVGLLAPTPEDKVKPHSSAYFISATEVHLMCHKQKWDGSEHYSVCPEAPDRINPVVQQGCSIIAAICMDVQNNARFSQIAQTAKQANLRHTFVCIPAAMSGRHWFSGGERDSDQTFLKSELNGKGRLILANSDYRGPKTFITGTDWRISTCVEDENKQRSRLLIANL